MKKIIPSSFNIILVIILTIANCSDNSRIPYQSIKNLSTDDAVQIIENIKDPIHWVRLNEQYLYDLSAKEIPEEEITAAYSYLVNRSKIENNLVGINAAYRYKSFSFVNSGELDSAVKYAHLALNSSNDHDSIDPLHSYHIMGVAYFYKNQNSDTTLKYWQKGYKEAELRKDNYLISLFATNLGSFYYNNGNTRNARSLFMRASETSIKMNKANAMLSNNIISTLIDEGQYQEADKFWTQHKTELGTNTQTYNGQLFHISRINLLQLLNRFDEAKQQINLIDSDIVKPTLFREFSKVYIKANLHEQNYNFLYDSIIKVTIDKNISYFAYNLKYGIIENRKQKEIQYIINKLIELKSDSTQFNKLSTVYKSSIFEILGNHFSETNTLLANDYLNQAIGLKNQSIKEQSKIQQRTIDELNQLENTFAEIKTKEEIIKEQKNVQFITIMAFALILVILILSLWLTRNHLKIKNIQQNQLETEQASLIKEQELNNRIVEYSKSIIERNGKLKTEILSTIATAPNAIKIAINQVLKDYQISHFNTEENPQIAKQLIKEKDDWNEQFPGFDNLNKTEQRVFVLTMENYRPKEIANVLGVSTQYVRNVKSRLKTKLNLKEDWGN